MTSPRLRWFFLALLFCSTLLNYLDRQSLSVLKPLLAAEFGFSNREYSYLVTAFLVPYVVMYLLSGPLTDRFGSRTCLAVFVGTWSLASILAGAARTVWQLGAARFLLGLAEPGNMPAGLRAVSVWFAPGERGLAVSVFSAGSALGSIIAVPAAAYLALHSGWRSAFWILGSLGLVWVVLWLAFFREPTRSTAGAPAAATSGRSREKWSSLFRDRALLTLLVARMISDPVWYFMLFWLPVFFQERKGLSLSEVGYLGWIPFLVADVGGIFLNYRADLLVQRGRNPVASRLLMLRGTAWLGLAGALLALKLDVAPSLAVFSIVGVACMTWFFATAALMADLFPPERVAGVLGIVGAAGALGAAIFNAVVGGVVDAVGFNAVFCVMALLHPCAAFVLTWGLRRYAAPPAPPQPPAGVRPAEVGA